jgi:hypothetical protein
MLLIKKHIKFVHLLIKKESLIINNMFCTYISKNKKRNYVKYNSSQLYFYEKYKNLRLPYNTKFNYNFFFVNYNWMYSNPLRMKKDKNLLGNHLNFNIINKINFFFILKRYYLKKGKKEYTSNYNLQKKNFLLNTLTKEKKNNNSYFQGTNNLTFKFIILNRILSQINANMVLKEKYINEWIYKIIYLINHFFLFSMLNKKENLLDAKITLKFLILKLIFLKKLLRYYARILRKIQLMVKHSKKFYVEGSLKNNWNIYEQLENIKFRNQYVEKSYLINNSLIEFYTKGKKKSLNNFYGLKKRLASQQKINSFIFSNFFSNHKKRKNFFLNKIVLKKKVLAIPLIRKSKKNLIIKKKFNNRLFFKYKLKTNLRKYRKKKELFSLKVNNTNSPLKFFNFKLQTRFFVRIRRKKLKIKRILRRLRKQRRLRRLFIFYKRGWLKKQVWILAKRNALRVSKRRQFYYGIYYLQIFYFLQILFRCGKKEKILSILFKMFNLIYTNKNSSIIGYLKTSFIALQRVFGFYKKSYKFNKKGRARAFNVRTPYMSLTEYSVRNAANNFAKGVKKNSKTFLFERMLNEFKIMKLKKGFAFNEGLVDFRGYKLKKLRKTYKALIIFLKMVNIIHIKIKHEFYLHIILN